MGRYTASAVASIAHNQVTGLVDGNVSRVLARVTRVGADIAAGHVTQHMWDTADKLVDQDRPGEFNQAMMELGPSSALPSLRTVPPVLSRPSAVHTTTTILVKHQILKIVIYVWEVKITILNWELRTIQGKGRRQLLVTKRH